MEYGNVIWHPIFKRQSKNLENVQRKATKILKEIKNLSYEERLKFINLPGIKYRQTRSDIMQTFRIIHVIDNIIKDVLFYN